MASVVSRVSGKRGEVILEVQVNLQYLCVLLLLFQLLYNTGWFSHNSENTNQPGPSVALVIISAAFARPAPFACNMKGWSAVNALWSAIRDWREAGKCVEV